MFVYVLTNKYLVWQHAQKTSCSYTGKKGTINFCCNVLIKEGQHENRY